MSAITPEFVVDLETRIQSTSQDMYGRLVDQMWWQDVLTLKTGSTSKREILTWLLSTLEIRDLGEEAGQQFFEDIVSRTNEYTHRYAGTGLRLQKQQLEDTDGRGLDIASHWSKDAGRYMAYWPQKMAATFLTKGHLTAANGGFTAYDGLAYFAASHQMNPYRPGVSVFNNVFTGAASGSYPGACPIDESVSVEEALNNLGKIFGYIAGLKQANGVDPLNLRPAKILCSPTLFPRAVQLTNAKFIAQAATSGGGSGDVEKFIQALGYAMPVMVPELASFEDGTSFFVTTARVGGDDMGAAIYSDREPFHIDFYGPMTQAQLNRMQTFEWTVLGRNATQAGHPWGLFKCKKT